MKNVILALSFTCISAISHALVNGIPSVDADITKTDSYKAEKLSPALQSVTHGQAQIENGALTLTLIRPTPQCPTEDCAIAPSAPIIMKFKMLNVQFSDCGDTYTAEMPQDQSSVKKEKQTMRLVDMSQATCDIVMNGLGSAALEVTSGKKMISALYFRLDRVTKK
jgi:hypothetical protein